MIALCLQDRAVWKKKYVAVILYVLSNEKKGGLTKHTSTNYTTVWYISAKFPLV
jgi:hypothetical protein